MSIINPAFSGIEYDYSLTFNSRNQWATIENSPSTQFFSISSKREKNLGIGLSFVANKAFIESRTMAYIDFSYKLQISSDTNLFLGLKPGGTFFDINFNNLSFNSDPALVNYSKFSPNLGIGVLLKSNNSGVFSINCTVAFPLIKVSLVITFCKNLIFVFTPLILNSDKALFNR